MTTHENQLLFLQTYLELERKIKILELEMKLINEKVQDVFEDKLIGGGLSCLEDIYNITESYLP